MRVWLVLYTILNFDNLDAGRKHDKQQFGRFRTKAAPRRARRTASLYILIRNR